MEYSEEPKAQLYGFDIPIQCIIRRVRKTNVLSDIHYHDYVELLYGLDCDANIWCNGKNFRLESGDLIVVHSKKPHTVMSRQETSTYVVIKFMPQILYAAEQSVLEFKYIVPFISDNDKYTNLFKKSEIEDSLIPSAINDIITEWNNREYGFEVALRAYTMKIALWLIRQWYKEITDSRIEIIDETTDAIHSIQKSIEFAQKHFNTATSFEAAQKCNLSYSYFSRLFKRVMKKSFTEYVNYIRITEAERLLATTSASITDIALDIGFSTTSYFIEKFKNQVHLTPKQFRQNFQKK